MKVILMKDVAQLGRRYDVKEVPTGHAFNFLIPRKLAISATPENLKRLEENKRKQHAHKEEGRMSFQDACKALKGRTISYTTDANDKGHLFKGINAEDISNHLEAQGISMPKEYIVLKHPLKEVGVHEIQLTHDGLEGVLNLEVSKK
jgi:large subunit ribosomal protein L9